MSSEKYLTGTFLVALLLVVGLTSNLSADDDGRVLFDFSKPDAAKAWWNVNDGVRLWSLLLPAELQDEEERVDRSQLPCRQIRRNVAWQSVPRPEARPEQSEFRGIPAGGQEGRAVQVGG